MNSSTTIVAIATPPGEGGLGMIRVSGPGAASIGRQLFRSSPPLGARPRTVEFGRSVSKDGIELDAGLAWFLKGPRSYTGEDTVEISCHGSQAILEAIVDAALFFGATPAQPGEFTRRAFTNGRIDLVQAEAVIDLIQAGSRPAAQVAYGQADGNLSQLVRGLMSQVVGVLSQIEAALDFAEEDLEALDLRTIDTSLRTICEQGQRLIDTFEGARRRQRGWSVVLVGRPNVGKSTLFNALLGEDKAIVAPEPGTTRDTVEATTTWLGESIRLVDTAGLREAPEGVEREGVRRARGAAERADLLLGIVDASREPAKEDGAVLELIRSGRGLLVLNKCDLPRRIGNEASTDEGGDDAGAAEVSALRGDGLSALQRPADERIRPGSAGGVALTRERHRECLQRAVSRCQVSALALERGEPPECAAAELNEALAALGELLGESVGEAVLDRIFAEFCIGK